MKSLQLSLGLAVALIAACGDEPIEVACVLPDGRTLGAGQSADDPCLVCNPRSGELAPSWEAGCTVTTRHAVDWHPFRVFWMELGPDADGDGLGDVVLAGFDDARRSMVAVVSAGTGNVVFEYQDEETDLEMGRGHRHLSLGPDVDGDGLADLALSSANALSDDDSSDFPTLVTAGFPNPGRVDVWAPASGTLVHRLEGERACDSLGNSIDLGPDMDGDGTPELVVTDGGCFTYDESGVPESGSGLDSSLAVYRAGTDEVVFRVETDDVRGGVGRGEARFDTLPESTTPVLAFSLTGG